jgi:hypothetical protein
MRMALKTTRSPWWPNDEESIAMGTRSMDDGAGDGDVVVMAEW